MSEVQQDNKILLTQEDARLYLAFKKNRSKFVAMLEGGVFDLSSGKAEINFNDNIVANIHIHEMTYTHKRALDKTGKSGTIMQ